MFCQLITAIDLVAHKQLGVSRVVTWRILYLVWLCLWLRWMIFWGVREVQNLYHPPILILFLGCDPIVSPLGHLGLFLGDPFLSRHRRDTHRILCFIFSWARRSYHVTPEPGPKSWSHFTNKMEVSWHTGYPLHHPFEIGIFHPKTHPAMVPPAIWKPPYGYRISMNIIESPRSTWITKHQSWLLVLCFDKFPTFCRTITRSHM